MKIFCCLSLWMQDTSLIKKEISSKFQKKKSRIFFKDLLEIWLKKIHKSLKFDDIAKFYMENYKQYCESFQREILDKASLF